MTLTSLFYPQFFHLLQLRTTPVEKGDPPSLNSKVEVTVKLLSLLCLPVIIHLTFRTTPTMEVEDITAKTRTKVLTETDLIFQSLLNKTLDSEIKWPALLRITSVENWEEVGEEC